MSEDLDKILSAAEQCASEKREKAFRILVAFAKDHPQPEDSSYRDAWTLGGLKAFTRALLNYHQYADSGYNLLELLNTGALYCEEAIDRIGKRPAPEFRDDRARFRAWRAEFMLKWVYTRENELPSDMLEWYDALSEDDELLHLSWNSSMDALSGKPTPEIAYHIQREAASSGAMVFARFGRRAITFADMTDDYSFIRSARNLLFEARTSLKCQGFTNLPAYSVTADTFHKLERAHAAHAQRKSSIAE